MPSYPHIERYHAEKYEKRGKRIMDWEKCPAVESIPGKHGGEWLFTKTRVPVSALFGNLAAGATIEEFLDWFQGVEKWQVNAVLEHVVENLDAKVRHENTV
jgi:uncharacterized protein (DUF433 family)